MTEIQRPSPPEPLGTPLLVPDDWPTQAADQVEKAVASVRARTTGPALNIARGIVYGLAGALIGLTLLVVLVIMAVRLLVVILPDDMVYLAHLITGLVFSGLGAWMWSRRRVAPAT